MSTETFSAPSAYYRYLYHAGLSDTPETLDIFMSGYAAGAADALRSSATIGAAIPVMRHFTRLIDGDVPDEDEQGSPTWRSR